MCGFAGFLGSSGPNVTRDDAVRRMAAAIRHRGPDDCGVWTDDTAGIALGHCRLSVIDTSPSGHQPMTSASGRFVIAFNGEIYNFQDLRNQLAEAGRAPQWRGHSDTEVLLAAIDAWGTTGALKRCAGMFAFALFDRQSNRLTLGRDRLGEKPLYWGVNTGVMLFGSDLAALKRHPLWRGEVDRDALALLLRFNNIPAPYSIYKGIAKLAPGTIAEFVRGRFEPDITAYWDANAAIRSGAENPYVGSAAEAVDETERLLSQSLAGQMIADVPLGAFLSGGIDSSAVVALMQKASQRPVKTFSIGFDERGYDEAPHAKAVARHLGTDHTELYVCQAEALATVPRLASVYSEPFADSSQIPALLVSELARRHVTVALSGDGGDELFSGYNRYTFAHRSWEWLRRIPLPLRRAIAARAMSVSSQKWDALARPALALLPHRLKPQRAGDKLIKAAGIASQTSLDGVYRALVSHWPAPNDVVIAGSEPSRPEPSLLISSLDPVRRMMLHDLGQYLPDDILVKVDRAAMAVSLEARVPMLDHRLVEFSASLPMDILRRNGQSKWPLRQVLYRYVPKSLVERPKMGFGVPLDSWLRGPLRDWAEVLLSEDRLKRDGFFHPQPIRKAWNDHLSGTRNLQHQLWVILMFQAWLDNERGLAP